MIWHLPLWDWGTPRTSHVFYEEPIANFHFWNAPFWGKQHDSKGWKTQKIRPPLTCTWVSGLPYGTSCDIIWVEWNTPFPKNYTPPPRKLTCPLWTIFLKENPSSKPLIFRRSFSGSCKAVFNCPIQGKRPCSALWNITKTGSFSPLKGDLKPSNKGHTSKTLLSPQFSRNLRVTPRCYATPPKQIRPYSGTINPHCLI